MNDFDRAFAFVIGAEGGYTADPHDRGNWTGGEIGKGICRGTKYGISAAAYPDLDIARLTLDEAKAIYRRDYWRPLCCDEFSYPKALVLFDCGVNQGVARAIRFAQAAVGVTVDGLIGPVTIGAIKAAEDKAFVDAMLAERERHYRSLKAFERYGKGWLARLRHVRAVALDDLEVA